MIFAVVYPAVAGQAVPAGHEIAGTAAIATEEKPQACTELTKAGDPCKGRPGDDGLCAAHKKGDGAAEDG